MTRHGIPRVPEPGDPLSISRAWEAATIEASDTAALNKVAALWTAASVVLAALASLSGAIG